MPEVVVTIPVKQVASIIKSMSKQELETLLLLLLEDSKELLDRTKDLKEKKFNYLTRDEVFDV